MILNRPRPAAIVLGLLIGTAAPIGEHHPGPCAELPPGWWCFDTSSIPPGPIVTSAYLKLRIEPR